jgi:hypothetical protein
MQLASARVAVSLASIHQKGRGILGLLVLSVLGLQAGAAGAGADAGKFSWALTNLNLESSMPGLIRRFEADRQGVQRFYELPWSSARAERLERLLTDWRATLGAVSFDSLDPEGRIDYLLLRNELDSDLARLRQQQARRREMQPLLPFLDRIHGLEVARWQMTKLDPASAAGVVAEIPGLVKQARQEVEKRRKAKTPTASSSSSSSTDADQGNRSRPDKSAKPGASPGDALAERAGGSVPELASSSTNSASAPPSVSPVSPALAQRTAAAVAELRGALKTWASYYDGVVPEFSWWLKKPNEAAFAALDDYAKFLREEIAGLKGKDEDPLVGDPIGPTALADDIAAEWLAYSPEDLLAIGERELRWCESEMKKAAAEMGLGDDWKAALARVKAGHVPPGQQDQIVIEEARSAIDFLKSHDLVTIPPLCEELWRTSMLTTDAQKTLPYAAYSGPNMLVAYARDDMKHDDKLMAMRGNNRHFTRLVTLHELIPGHHLEAFMTARHRDYRRPFRTPFFVEGWALYWEIVFWNLNYARGPEERIGMLFWRMHRCARIIVSLRFHLGQMTPTQMVDFIVDRVGHERAGATSEVRRFIGSDYSPLYQCAYMIGGLQLKALRDEVVGRGLLSDRQFNDAILRLGAIPIELVRASIVAQNLTPQTKPSWRVLAEPK